MDSFETKRKLATIRRINNITPIEGADLIECALVDGWNVVIKKGEYKIDDLVIYCEIDSWIPTHLAPFLSKSSGPRKYMNIEGERLKTNKFRGQISQGLLLPISFAPDFKEGDDVTEYLGIVKWEPPYVGNLSCESKVLSTGKVCTFPSEIPRTDQERIQNLKKLYDEYKSENLRFELTEKLDGSSCTLYLKSDGEFEVCSRNVNLKYDESNTFWQVAINYDVENKMKNNNLFGYAIQGELIGEKIQKNPYNIKGVDYYVFDIYDTNTKRYLNSIERKYITEQLGLKHCPILDNDTTLTFTISDFLKFAEDKSVLYSKAEREGIVAKCITNPYISFKVISNKFLLKCD